MVSSYEVVGAVDGRGYASSAGEEGYAVDDEGVVCCVGDVVGATDYTAYGYGNGGATVYYGYVEGALD